MNKDTVVASIIGFSLGLVAAVLIWVMPHLLPKTKPAVTGSPLIEASAENNPVEAISLEVSSPADGNISKEKTVEIKGKAQNMKLLTVSTQDDTQIVTLAPDGSFSAKVTLAEGGNQIDVTGYNKNKEEHQQLYMYYFEQN